jgi:hypothetical protein
MLQKSLLIVAIAAACCTVQAQSSPAKKEYVARILKAQQPGIENMAIDLVQDAAGNLAGRAGNALQQRVAADKQEAVGKEIGNDVRKFVDDTVPVVRDRAIRLAPTTIGTMLEEKFTEDELKQIAGIMESPAFNKFQSLGGDMQRVLVEKLLTDTRPTVEPRLKTLEETVAKRLGITPGSAAAPAAPAAANNRSSGTAPARR